MTEMLHEQVWSRFVRMPQGHILDYADKNGNTVLPTAQECNRAMPNALGWWTSIENGAFFTGLYVYALIYKYKISPDEKTAKEINILINGLKILQDVAKVDGFIARGVAEDDNVSHYPFSSEDQVVPWVLAMNAYLNCTLCEDKQDIKKRLLKTLNGVKNKDWKVPTEIECFFTNSWRNATDWRGVSKLLYCSRLIYELSGEEAALAEYETLRDTVPEGWYCTRQEIVANGFAPDMVEHPNLIQPWIFVGAHLGLKELCALDKENYGYYAQGIKADGITALRFIDRMKKYDNLPDGFDMNWRRLEPYQKPIGETAQAAIDNAGNMASFWAREVVPHRHMEHVVLGNSLFGAWIAVTCGDAAIEKVAREKLLKNCKLINWEDLHLSYAFAAEAALMM